MKRILILMGAYYPKPKANGICCEKIVNEFLSKGYFVTIVAFDNQIDKYEIKNNNLKIIYIKSSLYYRKILEEENGNKKKYKFRLVLQKFLNFRYPRKDYRTERRFYEVTKLEYLRNGIDLLIAVNSPIQSIAAAYKIKEKYSKIKVILYLLDPISENIDTRNLFRLFLKKVTQKWEKKVFSLVDKTIIMKSTENYYKNLYKNEKFYKKIEVCDIPTFSLSEVKLKKEKIFGENKYNLLYVGSLPNRIREPEFLLRVLSSEEINTKIRLIFIGISAERIPEKYKEKIEIVIIPQLSHEEVGKYMNSADFLVNIGNREGNMVPSKIFEYISYKKPIIHFYNLVNDPCNKYLDKYQLVYKIKETEEKDEIKKSTIELLKFFKYNREKKIDFFELKKRFIENTAIPFVIKAEQFLKNSKE